MIRSVATFLLVVWATLSVACLFQYGKDLQGSPAPQELDERLVIQSLAINFPMSTLTFFTTKIPAPLSMFELDEVVSVWFFATLAGYIQWAMIVPWLIRWILKWRSTRKLRTLVQPKQE
jgi:hypothetical protein